MTKAVWPPSSDQRAVHIAIAALVTAPMLDIFLCGILLVQGYAYLARMHRHTRSRAHRPPHSPAPVVPNRKEEINNSNSDNHANGGGGGQQSIRSKRSRLQQIARLTAVSAAVPTACAILNVILVAQPDKDVTRWHIVPSFLLGKLYVFSLLWTLEYRQRIISSDRSTERNKVPNRLDAQLIGVGVVVGGAAAGGSGKSDDRLARSASDDTSHKGGSDRSGSGCGRKKGIEDLVERGLSCRQGRKVVPTTAATHYPPSSIPLRMEMMSSEQGERRTSLGFLNRTSMFARTVLTPAGTQMTEENDHDVDLGNGVADADVGDIESQWGVQSLDKKGEIGFIDSLDTAKWEEKIGDQGLKN
ncbi:hypothetical protein FRC17_001615 [Serendipita sp. 399]|nr:hypothetical protein FRC17_001615 [Serendipita sp. 399]